VLRLSIAVNTSLTQLKKIPRLVEEVIGDVDLAEFERAHLTEFGDFSYIFEVVYYMKTANYGKYMDSQQEINFGILDAFGKEGIAMPLPTQAIFLRKED
jgi:small-conductance mechanosensitive channel